MMTSESQEFCCENCFEHSWLRQIAVGNPDALGRCYYCGNTASLTLVSRFRDGFANLLSDYIAAENANGGRDSYLKSLPVLDAIQRDWKLFSSRCRSGRLAHLFPTMFGLEKFPQIGNFDTLVVPLHRNAMSTAFGRWLEFWFIDPKNISEWISNDPADEMATIGSWAGQKAEHLRGFIRSLENGLQLWRARGDYLGSSEWDCQPLPIEQMGNNPKCPASRLNREGEVVLYAAESEKTALAEIRPGRGYICTTCELQTNRDLQVLDLASPLAEINPFTQTQLSWQLDLQRVARNVSAQIAKPISRGEDSFVYGRTQYLARLIRAMSLDGIRFSSSLDGPGGVNLAIFDTTAVSYANPRLVTVTSAQMTYKSIDARYLRFSGSATSSVDG